MVAVITGSGLGIEHSSAFVLGSRGQLGQSALGRVGENVFVNAKTGNLAISNRDAFLVGLGADSAINRTYNSQGALDGDNNDGWRAGVTRRVHGLTGTLNAAGSTITRTGWDGSAVVYSWNATSSAYVTKAGGGAYDTLAKVGTTWVWTDGDSQTTEVYEESGTSGEWRIASQIDRDGNTLGFTYNGSGYVSRVATEVGTRTEYTDLVYSGANLTELTTTYWDADTSAYVTSTRTRYGYDGSNRLTSVTIDLSPTDNSIADGHTYVTSYTYVGSSKRVATISQTDGSHLAITYETSGQFRVLSLAQTVATGVTRTTSFSYVTSTRTDVTNPDGYVTRLDYDAAGQLTQITEPAAVAGGTAQVRTFTYNADGDVTRVQNGPNAWTDYAYSGTGVWTARHEHQGSGATIATTRTYNAKNAVLTETRYQGLDPDGTGAGTASGAMTTRYAYDAQNNLRYTVSAIGDVTRFDYSADGLLTRTTVFTGQAYNVSGLSSTTAIAESTLNTWVSGITDKTQAAITENTYDFRGNLSRTTSYSSVLSTGLVDTSGPKTRIDYVYDQSGQLLSRVIDGKAGSELYVYDGMGRNVSAIDFNGEATTTAFHDALGITVVSLANGLNQISTFNRAGERVDYVETERGANLIDLNEWPEGTPPAGKATVNGWQNIYTNDTRWTSVTGPDGKPMIAVEAGQIATDVAGGGNNSNKVTIDGNEAYEFVYYFQKYDLSAHALYFGMSTGSPAYAENATTGADATNPMFYVASAAQQQATLEDDRWYKVVGYVLPEGSATVAAGSLGGVYDMTTGTKVADTTIFRWNDARPEDKAYLRFFNYLDQTETRYSTYFGKPEIRQISADALLNTVTPPSTQFRYDNMGRLRLETDPTGARTHHLYDRVGRKVADIDADGSLAEYKYDLNDRLIATVRYATRLTPTQLDSLVDGSGNPTAVELSAVRPSGHADDAWTWQVYDDAGRVTQTIAGDGSTTLYTYDGASRLLSETRRAEKLNSTQLTAFKTTPPSSVALPSTSGSDRTTRHFFDADGRRIGSLDAEGYVSQLVYDAGGRLIQTKAFAEKVTNGTLLATGTFSALLTEVQSPVNANDIRSWNVYDGRGLLRGSVNGEGDIVLYDYDASGHLSQTVTGRKLTVPAGGLANQPTLASLVAASASGALETTTYTRNAYGQVLTETKALAGGNETTTYTYNAIRQLVAVSVDRLSGQGPDYEVRSRYDARGRLIGQLSGEGSAALAALGGSPSEAAVDGIYRKWGTRFEYDDADRLIARIDADGLDGAGRKTLYYYDPDGNLAYEVSAVGAVTGHVYDALNRRTETITYGAAISTSGLVGGDLVGGLPSRTSLGSTDSRVIIAYTVTGAVASTTERVTTSENRTTSFTYNAFGELTTRSSPFGPNVLQTLYGYDKRGSTTSVMESNNGVSRIAWSTYDAFGREIQSTDARGVVRTTDYDRAGRVKVSRDGFNNTTTYTYDARGHVLTSQDRLGKTTSYSHSAFGRQMTVTTPEGLVSTIAYDDQGHVLTATDGAGRSTTHTYDRNGALVSSTNGLSETSTRSYDFAGQLYEATDASGVTVRYAYDGVGRQLTRRVDPAGLNLLTTYTYDAKGQVIGVVDPAGVETQYSFDLLGQTTAVTVDPGGLGIRTEYTYDDLGNVTQVREAEGSAAERDISYTYDELSRVSTQQTGSAGLYIKSTYAYDAHDNVIRRTDSVNASTNVVTRYAYDAENRLVWTIDGTGSAVRTFHDAEGRITRTVAYATALTPAQITALGLAPTVAQVTSAVTTSVAQDRSQAYVYDDDGRLVFSLAPTGRLSKNEYDGSGNVTRSILYATAYTASQTPTEAALATWTASNTSSSDRISRAAYDDAGRQAYSIDAGGYVTRYAYDPAGRVIRSLQYAAAYTLTSTPTKAALDTWASTNAGASDRKSHVAYDAAGRAAFQVDAEGYVTRYTYDAAGQVTAESRFAPQFTVTDGVTATTLSGLVASHVGTAATSAYHYDDAGRLYRSIDAEGVETRLTLDGLGRATTLVQAYGTPDAVTTTRTYDAGSRLVSEVQASGKAEARTLSWTYDGLGRALTETDGESRVTTRTYDAMGRVLTVTRPLSVSEAATTTNQYDTFGNLVKITDPRGNASVFYFDLLDRMTHQVDPENYVTRTTYTLGGAVASTTRYVTKVSGTPVVGTLPTITTHADDATTTFARDKLDRLTGITDAESKSESYSLNAFGNRISVTNKVGGVTTHTYDKRGLMLSEVLPITSTRADGTVQSSSVTNTYQYDSRGNLTQMVEASGLTEARTTTYTYDKLNRLVTKAGTAVTVTSQVNFSTSSATPTETITYDKRGNVIQTVQADGAKRLFFYDALDRKVAEVDALGGLQKWTYDKADNATSVRAWDTPVAVPSPPGGTAPAGTGTYRETLYVYDKANRLTSTSVANVQTGRYNGSAYTATVATVTTSYVYDKNGNLIETTDALGNKTFNFYDKLGREVARVDAEKYVTTYTRDAEGNVTEEVRYAIPKTGTITTATAITSLPPRTANASLGDRITTFTYDENGRRLTESRAGVVSYTVNATTGAMSVGATASTITYAYDGLGNVTSRAEANGDTTTYTYDALGRQTKATRSAFTDYTATSVQHETVTAYNGIGGVTRQTEGKVGASAGDLRITTYAYDVGGRLTSTTDATGFTQTFGYDIAGRVVQESWTRSLAASGTTVEGRRYAYDALGRIVTHGTITKPASTWQFGDQRTVSYNAHGEVIAQGLGGGTQETFAYDAAGRMWRSTGGDGVLRFYVYDAVGNATLEVASAGADLSSHTAIGTVLTAVSTSGQIGLNPTTGVTLTYTVHDKRGQVTQVREPHRQLSRNLTSGAYTTTTIVRSTSYNAFGEVTSQTDARGGVTDFTYNTLGRIIEQKSPQVAWTNEAGGVTNARPTETRRYDISGRLIATQDANGNWSVRTLLAHTGHGGSEAVTLTQFNADTGKFQYGYDVFGDLRKVTDALGFVTTKAYDKAGRLTQVVHPGRAAGTPGNPSGGTVQLTDNYEYDELGQRIRHWNSQFGSSFKERTEYDLEGRILSTTDFEGRTTSYAYTWNGALETEGLGTFGAWVKTTTHASAKTSTDITDYFGRSIGRTDLGGRDYEMTFDTAGRLLTQTSDAGQSLAYEWYNTGLMAEIEDVSSNAMTASSGKTLINYEYDAAGNRTRERSQSTRYDYNWAPGNSYHLNTYDDLYGYGDPGAPTVTTSTVLHQDAYATWDALNRMLTFTDSGAGGTHPVSVAYTYDLNGNVRSVIANYQPFGTTGTATQAFWYKYDVMNRFTTVMGDFVGTAGSGSIVRGGNLGRDITWDVNGNRKTVSHTIEDIPETYGGAWEFNHSSGYQYDLWEGEGSSDPNLTPPNPGWSFQAYPAWYDKTVTEHYSYTADGYLAEVKVSQNVWDPNTGTAPMSAQQLQGRHVRDAMGRTTAQTEWWFDGTQSHSRTATYDKTGLVLSDSTATKTAVSGGGIQTQTTNTTYTYNAETSPGSGVFTGQWLGVVTQVASASSLSGGGGTTNSTSLYTYSWWDSAQQARIVHTPNTASSGTKHTSTFAYDVNGRLTFVNVQDGRPRNITYVTDMAGQVMARREADTNGSTGDPEDYSYFLNGIRIGQVGNDYAGFQQYATLVNNRYLSPASGPFAGGSTAFTYAEFDQSYTGITPDSPGSAGTAYTARAGDTLAGIAQAVWGDASLWYLLAEANGLTNGSVALDAGRVITVPAKVGNAHNTSSTFKPYDPNRAIGDVNPTEPKPPAPQQSGKCGTIGKILVVIVAVAVTVMTKGLLAKASAGLLKVIGSSAVASGAVAGASGALAGQVFGVATGIQEKIDWKGIGIAALSGGIAGGLAAGKAGALFDKIGKATHSSVGAAARGAVGNVLTQGVAKATGLQHKFDWTGVAVAAVVAGTDSLVGPRLPVAGPLSTQASVNDFISAGVGGLAGAATRSLIEGSSFGDNFMSVLPDVIGQTIGNAVGRTVATAQAKAEYMATAGPELVAAGVRSGFVAEGSVDMVALNDRLSSGYDDIARANSGSEMKMLADALTADALDLVYSTPEARSARIRGEQWLTRYSPAVFGYRDGTRPQGYVGGFDFSLMENGAYRDDFEIGGRKFNLVEIQSLFNPLAGTQTADGATIVDDIVVSFRNQFAFHPLIDDPALKLGNLAYNVGGQIESYLNNNPEVGIAISVVDFGLRLAKGPLGFVATSVVDEVAARGAEYAVGKAASRFADARYDDAPQGGLGVFLGVMGVLGSGKGTLDLLKNSGRLIDGLAGQGRRLDLSTRPHPNIPIDPQRYQAIRDTPKPDRPDPSTYLPESYIRQYLQSFDGPVARIQPRMRYTATGELDLVGPPQGTYVLRKSDLDRVVLESGGDPRIMEDMLGLIPGDLGDAPVRVDIPRPEGLRMPSGREPGANDRWLPGGYNSGGIREAVINPVLVGAFTYEPVPRR